MNILSSVPFWIIAILMMGLLILVHESGHYITGRLLNFKINEFSVGMGPCIFSKEKKGTKYSLRAIPMGGFVAFDGEDSSVEGTDPRSMNNMPWYKRAIVMFSGAGFNIIFAFLLTAILVCATGYYAPQLSVIDENAPIAQVAEVGDIVVGVNGKSIVSVSQFSDLMSGMGESEAFDLTVLRDGEKVTYTTQKFSDGDSYRVGISYGYVIVKQNVFQSFGYSFKYNVWMTKTMYKTLWGLLDGSVEVNNLTGPVSTIGSIGSMVKEVASYENTAAQRARDMLIIITELLVIISMNLAIVNLLPLPALDGFKLFSAIIEGITKKHLPRKVEAIVNICGLFVLFGLMIVLEISKLFC